MLGHNGDFIDGPIKAAPNEVLKMLIVYTNLSGRVQPNVRLLVKSSSELEVIRGIVVANTSTEKSGEWRDEDLTGPPVDIGGYFPEGNAIVGFYFRVGDTDYFDCGTSRFTPQVFLTSGSVAVSAEYAIDVSRSC